MCTFIANKLLWYFKTFTQALFLQVTFSFTKEISLFLLKYDFWVPFYKICFAWERDVLLVRYDKKLLISNKNTRVFFFSWYFGDLWTC